MTFYKKNTAMHLAIEFYTKKWGYVVIHPHIKGYPGYIYCSNNGTPSTSTFYIGPNKSERKRSKIRRLLMGHNFDYDNKYNRKINRLIIDLIEGYSDIFINEIFLDKIYDTE